MSTVSELSTASTRVPGASAIACTGLVYAFGETRAVDGIDLEVDAGAVYGLLGPNGAGKTTAIRAVTTLLPVPPGMVSVFGHDVATDRMDVRRMLGYVPQQLSADSGLTGRENVVLFARLFDVPRRQRAEWVAAALDAVGLLDAADRMAGTYSGGMVRRLELRRHWSRRRVCSSSTSRRSAWTRSRAPPYGSESARCARPPA